MGIEVELRGSVRLGRVVGDRPGLRSDHRELIRDALEVLEEVAGVIALRAIAA
jgi:hypothetical protein